MNVELSSLVNVAIPVDEFRVPLVILAKLVSSRYNDKSTVSVVPSSFVYVKILFKTDSDVTVSANEVKYPTVLWSPQPYAVSQLELLSVTVE